MCMKVEEQDDKSVLTVNGNQGFLFIAQQAINIAARRNVPTEFVYKGCTVTVTGKDKVTQVYSNFLKNYANKTASCPMRLI